MFHLSLKKLGQSKINLISNIYHFSKSQNRKRIHSSPRTSGDESTGSPGKKIRASAALSGRRKVARRLPFDEDKSSPVSGTLIRELADGEEIPPIHKGKSYISILVLNAWHETFSFS